MSTPVAQQAPPVDVERAEAALVEHYPRLVRIAYLVLPPSLGRNRRVLTAHALTQRSLPRRRTAAGSVPAARRSEDPVDPGYAYVRERVLRQALEAEEPLGRTLRARRLPRRSQLPPLLPQVWGLRLFPRSGGADELSLDQQLSALSAPARAGYVLRGLEGLADPEACRVLAAAGVEDPAAALAEADGVETLYALLDSVEFDPCSLQARPTDLMRRRQHGRAALVAAAAAVVVGALLGLPGGWGPDGAAAPPYALNAAAQDALDPQQLQRTAPAVWERSARTDFSVWPARGELSGDQALLRRALAVWARPGSDVRVSATPGTPSGPAMGPAQLLFAGVVDEARVVLVYDGLRVVRYAEPVDGDDGAALDFARADGADAAASGALVVGRAHGNVRYLTAPWVSDVQVRDLLKPAAGPRPLHRDGRGVADPLLSPAQARDCTSWEALVLREGTADRVVTDLGELTAVRLTSGPPNAPVDVVTDAARAEWARTACLLPTVRSHGVRSVNSWKYAEQPLPEANGTAGWLCTRAETWRGPGARVMAQFQAPGQAPAATGAVAAKAEGSPACGVREPRVLAGVLWKSRGGQWYVLAAGSPQLASVTATGGVSGTANGRFLALKAPQGARAELAGRLVDGTRVGALR
ncbi:hypothetical protein ABT160_15260 [Streptomyces sp. NPDC001941]|uniref:hypothetical protein n=1 Tax=Streptomyces sp. NPDC001941 TaxID=3154659 RepID=UPI00332DB643